VIGSWLCRRRGGAGAGSGAGSGSGSRASAIAASILASRARLSKSRHEPSKPSTAPTLRLHAVAASSLASSESTAPTCFRVGGSCATLMAWSRFSSISYIIFLISSVRVGDRRTSPGASRVRFEVSLPGFVSDLSTGRCGVNIPTSVKDEDAIAGRPVRADSVLVKDTRATGGGRRAARPASLHLIPRTSLHASTVSRSRSRALLGTV
jgi:hypothetical protein